MNIVDESNFRIPFETFISSICGMVKPDVTEAEKKTFPCDLSVFEFCKGFCVISVSVSIQ